MGQPITIDSRTTDGAVAAFHTDRSITGQDGVRFTGAAQARDAGSMPGELAARLFDADPDLDHVFIASNQVVVRRDGVWNDAALTATAEVIGAFFVFYPEG